jgi:hypothetical protein
MRKRGRERKIELCVRQTTSRSHTGCAQRHLERDERADGLVEGERRVRKKGRVGGRGIVTRETRERRERERERERRVRERYRDRERGERRERGSGRGRERERIEKDEISGDRERERETRERDDRETIERR